VRILHGKHWKQASGSGHRSLWPSPTMASVMELNTSDKTDTESPHMIQVSAFQGVLV
jgi:hypothetical protein